MKHQLEFRHIRYFLAVAEELHFRRAAESLFISQPALSRQVKDMESMLGIKLFQRTNRKVNLTKAGEYLHKELRDYSHGLDQLFDHARLLHNGLSGELRIGYVGSAIQNVIPKLLLRYEKNHPKILITLKELDNQTQIKGILDQQIEVGFVRLDYVPNGLSIHPVQREPFYLVLPANHEINETNFTNLDQLQNDSFILFNKEYSPSYYEKVIRLFEDAGFKPKITHNSIHSSTIYKLVEHHFGISIVPRSLVTPHSPGIQFIELKNAAHRTTLSAVWNSNGRNPALQAFVTEIKKINI